MHDAHGVAVQVEVIQGDARPLLAYFSGEFQGQFGCTTGGVAGNFEYQSTGEPLVPLQEFLQRGAKATIANALHRDIHADQLRQ